MNNLSEIVKTTLRNRTGELVKNLTASNALLQNMISPWEVQTPGSMRLPDFIKLRAQNKAKMENGRVYVLKDGLGYD